MIITIIMLSIGILCIILSFTNKDSSEKVSYDYSEVNEIVETMLNDKFNKLNEDRENEWSKQKKELEKLQDDTIKKIENSNEDVLFLYNMLSQKEKNLKELFKATISEEKKPVKKIEKVEIDKKISKNFYKKLNNSIEKSKYINELIKYYTIEEISRELGIGQGEIKLMLNLKGDIKNE